MPVLTPARGEGPRLPRRAAGPGARRVPGRRLRRPHPAGGARRSRAHGWVNLHFSLLPAWRGAAPGAARDHGRRRGDRRLDVRHRARPRHRAGLRRHDRDDPARPTPPATCSAGSRRPAPACSSRRWTASRSGDLVAGAAAGRGRLARPEDRGRRRPHRLGAARPRRSTGSCAGCTPAPGRVDDLPRRAAQDRAGDARPPGRGAGPRHARGRGPARHEAGRLRRHRHRPVRLGTVQAHGKKPMPAADWARGVRIEAGERVGDE